MFGGGGGIWGGIAPPADNILDKERSPPARPFPAEFPSQAPSYNVKPLANERMQALRQTLTQFRKLPDAQNNVLDHFNLRLEINADLLSFVPKQHFDERPFPYDSDLEAMLNELSYQNEDAFREILRLAPLEGRTKPKVAYSRNFYASLEDMSRYWDNTRDCYYFATATDTDREMQDVNGTMISSKVSAPTSDPPKVIDDNTTKGKEVYKGYRIGNSAQLPQSTRVAVARNFAKMFTHKFNCRDNDVNQRERLKIKDVIIPPQLVMYTFNICRIPSDRTMARARHVEGPILSVYARHEVIWNEETRDRLTRQEKRDKGEVGEFVDSSFDLMREIGGLLVLAQQRAREGGEKADAWVNETQDWWWAHSQRWGGGKYQWGQMAGEVFEDEDPSWSAAELQLQLQRRVKADEEKKQLADLSGSELKVEDLMATTRVDEPAKKRTRLGLPERIRRGGDKAKKPAEEKTEYRDGRRLMSVPLNKKKWYEGWKEVKPNTSPWDDKVIYKRIGAEDENWDEVYQIGCINHHVCLMRMRVSRKYLRWIEKGIVDETAQPSAQDGERVPEEDILHIQRSKYFDLFDIERRKEFLIGMWRVMSWLNRNEIPVAEYKKVERLKTEAAGQSTA